MLDDVTFSATVSIVAVSTLCYCHIRMWAFWASLEYWGFRFDEVRRQKICRIENIENWTCRIDTNEYFFNFVLGLHFMQICMSEIKDLLSNYIKLYRNVLKCVLDILTFK